jgi:stearoyl-CoA desaturase (delta-9 desaturase)
MKSTPKSRAFFRFLRHFVFHLLPLGAIWTGVEVWYLWWFIPLLAGRLFFVTAGYHRYFSHKSYKLDRVTQFIVAFLAQTSIQKGALWWAAHHRKHHQLSDKEGDPHNAKRGFWWSHMGWSYSDESQPADYSLVPDLAKYPELVWLDKHPFFPPFVLGLIVLLCGGWGPFFFSFGLANIGVWHLTYTINSLAHVVGTRRFATEDSSRNNFFLAILLLGEGWHNNHHAFPTSIRQGLYWYEIDITYYLLKIFSFTGIVRGLKYPPKAAYAHKRVKDGHLDIGMVHTHAHRMKKLLRKLKRNPAMHEERLTLMQQIENLTKEAERIARGYKRKNTKTG